MPTHDDMLIRVQSEWKGWRNAEVRLHNIQDIHWRQPRQAPHPLMHGYISCTHIVTGDIPHDCDRAAPHRLLVCVLKKHTIPSAFEELARRADQEGERSANQTESIREHPTTPCFNFPTQNPDVLTPRVGLILASGTIHTSKSE